MASEINAGVFIRDHSDVWHPNKYTRWEARAKVRRLLQDLPGDHVSKVFEHLKYPCLMKQKELYEDYLKHAEDTIRPDNYQRILKHVEGALAELGWIHAELGAGEVKRPGWLESIEAAIHSEKQTGTLLAYVS